MRKIYFSLFILLFSFHSRAQILINEVCSAGDTAFKDEDGQVNDWIEFYNAGSAQVNLAGYKIKCAENNKTYSWTFPTVYVQPQQRITVFCSGKNRKDYFDHWEVPVYPNLPGKYMPGVVAQPPDWADVSFNDFSWATNSGNVGYGDGDDITTIAPNISLYQRYTFNIADTSNIAIVAFLVDYDDAFVAYFNGKEIARANIGAQGFPPLYNEYAFNEHEAQNYQNGGFSGFFSIPSSELDTMILPGPNTLAIETHNYDLGMDDMTMIPYFLLGVIDTSVTYFPFAANVHLHTDFQLSGSGEILTLVNPLGTIIEQDTIGMTMLNHSRGRQPDGNANWCLFNFPTPDTVNFSAGCFIDYGPDPVISLASGFYPSSQTTGITAGMAGNIYWTSDGSEPTTFSNIYSSSITIPSTQVLRARLFPSTTNYLPGYSSSATYFINENVTLPVVSLSTDPANLFDPVSGLYVTGNTPDTTFGYIPFYNANFWQGWKCPADVQFFDKNKVLQFSEKSSIKIQGNWSKMFPQRGFTVSLDENYGGNILNYQLFPDKPATTYYNFNVRNAGSDWGGAHYRDRLLQKSAEAKTDIDVMDGYACVLFLNGQYWGVYELREKEDKHYIKNNSNTDDDNVDFLEFDGNVINGDNKSFFNTVQYVTTADMTLQSSYDSAFAMIDKENFADYFITETYGGNLDWLGSYTNNIKFWKPHTGPGKWRYILWDTDLTFQSDTLNKLSEVINPPTPNPHSEMLSALLMNDTFRNYFINRYADLLNTIYYGTNMVNNSEAFYNEMLPEMSRHFAMWGTGSSPYAPVCIQAPENVAVWRNNIDFLEYNLFVRPYYVRNQIQSQFAMNGQVVVGLQTDPPGAGTIHLNTIIPDSLPWNGIYFDGNPITITAIPQTGYKFLYWKSNYTTNGNYPWEVLRTNVAVNDTFTAVFRSLEPMFEIYPNPFYDELTIYYETTEPGIVELKVYDVTGRLVSEILPSSDYEEPGPHTLHINAAEMGLSNGMYFFRFDGPSYSKTVKIISGRPN
ncbi:MAG: CotH kinase family protein [Bacteroidetes bacterium]|nr:CotH kinase family protein [Bacteroidota bacterium]